MSTKLFGQFLLEKGFVTREQLLHGLSEQRSSTGTLGDLAVATGMLEVHDVDAIYMRQLTHEEPFSKAAVQLGLLTEAQLAELLHPQSAERLLLGQILLAFGYLDRRSLREALEAHTSERVVDDQTLMKPFRQSDLSGLGAGFVAAMRSVFKETVSAPVSFQPLPPAKAVSAGQVVWSQAVTQGDDTFILAIQLSEAEAAFIAGAVLGMPVDYFDELAVDAMSEFLNIVTGHVCGNLPPLAGHVSADPPRYQRPEAFLEAARPEIALFCTSDRVQFTYLAARQVSAEHTGAPHWTAAAVDQG